MDLATQIAELFATALLSLARTPNARALHDAYQTFCALLMEHYPAVNFHYLADRPASASRRASFAEDLVDQQAHNDHAVVTAALALGDALQAAATANAATRLTWWVATSTGKIASVSGAVNAGSFHIIMPLWGPLKVLPAEPVSTAAPSLSGSWNCPPAISPA